MQQGCLGGPAKRFSGPACHWSSELMSNDNMEKRQDAKELWLIPVQTTNEPVRHGCWEQSQGHDTEDQFPLMSLRLCPLLSHPRTIPHSHHCAIEGGKALLLSSLTLAPYPCSFWKPSSTSAAREYKRVWGSCQPAKFSAGILGSMVYIISQSQN